MYFRQDATISLLSSYFIFNAFYIYTKCRYVMMQVHSNNVNVRVQALMLLDNISFKNQVVSDRFYRALYAKLLLPAAMNSSKASLMCSITILIFMVFGHALIRRKWKILWIAWKYAYFRQKCLLDFFSERWKVMWIWSVWLPLRSVWCRFNDLWFLHFYLFHS